MAKKPKKTEAAAKAAAQDEAAREATAHKDAAARKGAGTRKDAAAHSTDRDIAARDAGTHEGAAQDAARSEAPDVAQIVREEVGAALEEKMLPLIQEETHAMSQELSQAIREAAERQIAKAHRRRRWSNFFHDVVIVALVVVAVYFGYCLYDAHYFNFLKTDCEKSGTCTTGDDASGDGAESSGSGSGTAGSSGSGTGSTSGTSSSSGQTTTSSVKNKAWYLANYHYLYDELNLRSDADSVAAYYLYSADFQVSDLPAKLLLGMAYNQLEDKNLLNAGPETETIRFSSADLSKAFAATFGDAVKFTAVDFDNGCLHFLYEAASDTFAADNVSCARNAHREIVEEVENIYADGEVMYVITMAGVLDKDEQALYNFDNLFRPVAFGLGLGQVKDLSPYSASLNRYQYKFVRDNGKYHFRSVTKLQ